LIERTETECTARHKRVTLTTLLVLVMYELYELYRCYRRILSNIRIAHKLSNYVCPNSQIKRCHNSSLLSK